MNTDTDRHDEEAEIALHDELAQLRKDKARLGTIIREHQIFTLALSAKLGCIADTDDMLRSVDKLHKELPQMRSLNKQSTDLLRGIVADVDAMRDNRVHGFGPFDSTTSAFDNKAHITWPNLSILTDKAKKLIE